MSNQSPGILIVDDEIFFREAISDILSGAGFRCTSVESGEEALDAAARVDVGVVVLDVRLPGIDGIEVLERLRELRPSLRVIMLSASDDQELVLDALRLGACDYLAKPLHDEELVLAVRRALDGFVVSTDWTQLRGRLDRLVARVEELASLVAAKSGEERTELLHTGLTRAVSEALEAEKTSLMLLDEDGEWLRVVACEGRDMKPEEFDAVAVGQGVAGLVLDAGDPLVVTDVSSERPFSEHRHGDRYTTPSFMIAPLHDGQKPLGVLCATDRAAGGAFSNDDLALLRLLAVHAAELVAAELRASEQATRIDASPDPDTLALGVATDGQGAHAVDVLPKRSDDELDRDAELAREICQSIVDEVEPERVLAGALRALCARLPAAPVSIFLVDPNDGSLRRECESDGGVCGDRDLLERAAGLTGNVLQTGHVVATDDPSADPRFDPETDTPLGGQVRPFLCLPLRLRGKVVGVFRAFLQEGGEASPRTAEVIGAALSAAIRNALLYRSLVDAIEEVAEARRSARR